jgi:hypothetical protein
LCLLGITRKDARKYAGPVEVIPVESFPQALRALATLPAKAKNCCKSAI